MTFAACFGNRLHQTRMIVPQGRHGNAGECIEVGLAAFVEKPNPLASLEGDWQTPIRIHQVRHHFSWRQPASP